MAKKEKKTAKGTMTEQDNAQVLEAMEFLAAACSNLEQARFQLIDAEGDKVAKLDAALARVEMRCDSIGKRYDPRMADARQEAKRVKQLEARIKRHEKKLEEAKKALEQYNIK